MLNSLQKQLEGKLAAPTKSGWCLQQVRYVIEDYLEIPDMSLYKHWKVEHVADNKSGSYWARDLQANMRRRNWGVKWADRQGGDILSTWQLAKEGHIAVFLTPDLLVECTTARGFAHKKNPALRITPLVEFPKVELEIFRIQK